MNAAKKLYNGPMGDERMVEFVSGDDEPGWTFTTDELVVYFPDSWPKMVFGGKEHQPMPVQVANYVVALKWVIKLGGKDSVMAFRQMCGDCRIPLMD